MPQLAVDQRAAVDRTVIQIVGLGHSGTTILDMAIGAHPQAWSLGEVKKLPAAVAADKGCTCGKPVSRCEFWSRVITRAAGGGHRQVFQAVFDAVPAPVVVDSSMPLARARAVRDQLDDNTQVKLLHMVRDVRSWVLSRQRAHDRNRHLSRRGLRKSDPAELGERWARENARIRLAGLERGWDYLRVRHEDLCADPARTLTTVHAWAGLPPWPATGELTGTYHLFAGNRARNTARRIEPAREPWRDDPARADLYAYGRPAALVARLLGYGAAEAPPRSVA